MRKISEQKALEAYPFEPVKCGGGIADSNSEYRGLYQEGYDQAMQDFLEKACEWWKNTLEYNPGTQHVIESFKNYIQNEM